MAPLLIFQTVWQRNNLKASDMNPSDIGCLQLLLLGCKPAIYSNQLALAAKDVLMEQGYKCQDDWIYDPVQIEALCTRYPDFFQDGAQMYFQEPMSALDDMHSGLLMGIPYDAAQKYANFYANKTKKECKDLGGIAVNIFGHCWVEGAEMSYSSLEYISTCISRMMSSGMLEAGMSIMPKDLLEVYTCDLRVMSLKDTNS
jgi:hypothetical protein